MQSLGLIDALLVVLIGMVIVFFGLVILIMLIKLLVSVTAGKKKAPVPVLAPIPMPRPAVQPAVPAEESADDTALIAAITAALAVVMEGSGFQVKHIRRIQNTPAWQRAGREEQIYSHF